MSKELFARLNATAEAMVLEHTDDASVKLTLAALAARVGVSTSTVKRSEYAPVRKKLKAAKPKRTPVVTNDDAVEWRSKYYAQRKEFAAVRNEHLARIGELENTVDGLVQKIQALSLSNTK